MSEYRIQRLKEELTYAQHRNKHQKQQLANYKKVHEKDLKEIERLQRLVTTYDELLLRQNNKVDMLHSIIKEVREYIDRRDIEWGSAEHNHVLEILGKENKE